MKLLRGGLAVAPLFPSLFLACLDDNAGGTASDAGYDVVWPDGARDTSLPDAGQPPEDAGDAGDAAIDATQPDTSAPDTSAAETSLPDTSVDETSLPDTSVSDT